jgi:phosphate transport system substrate-binding protein
VVGGSSAFATATAQVAGAYESYCGNSRVQVVPSNSQQGMEQLHATVAGQDIASRVAMSDGRADSTLTGGTQEKAVAIVPYTIVLNQKVFPTATGPVVLSMAQVRRIFDGHRKSWHDVDPRFADLEVKIVARGQSGSRIAFERYVLGDGRTQTPQGVRTSSNCVDQDYTANGATFLCEESSTDAVIDRVSTLDGAVGYADAPDVGRIGTGLIRVRLDDRGTTIQDIDAGYPFWTVEHGYYRSGSTLPAAFVAYLASADRAPALAAAGYPPCSVDAALCAQR